MVLSVAVGMFSYMAAQHFRRTTTIVSFAVILLMSITMVVSVMPAVDTYLFEAYTLFRPNMFALVLFVAAMANTTLFWAIGFVIARGIDKSTQSV